jgi:hypothetical protein
MTELENLWELLKAQPDAFHELTIGKILCFVTCAARLRDNIILTQPPELSSLRAPKNLPPSIRLFLVQTCTIPERYADVCWSAFKDTIWSEGEQLQSSMEPHFRNHGHAMGIGMCISIFIKLGPIMNYLSYSFKNTLSTCWPYAYVYQSRVQAHR